MVDPEGTAWDAYIWIDNADALYAEFKSKGVKIARQICDQLYGCRDFDVEDCKLSPVFRPGPRGVMRPGMNAIPLVASLDFVDRYVSHTKANEAR